MAKRKDSDLDRMHWENLVRTIIDLIGVDGLEEVIDYVIEQMQAERERLRNFAIETRRAER